MIHAAKTRIDDIMFSLTLDYVFKYLLNCSRLVCLVLSSNDEGVLTKSGQPCDSHTELLVINILAELRLYIRLFSQTDG